MANTEQLKALIQSEIEKQLAAVKKLQEKLALIDQVEELSNEFSSGIKDAKEKQAVKEKQAAKPVAEQVTPESGVSETQNATPNPTLPEGVTVIAQQESIPIGDTYLTGNNPYAFLHQGFQAYLAGKPDKAIELFRQARELNPSQFEKSWNNMTSIPIYTRVAHDKYLNESLFPV